MGEIFFDCSENEIMALAFNSDSPAPPESPLPIPMPSEGSAPSKIEDYLYSDHALTGLVRVTPCRFSDKPGYSGMLLHFSNGHRESAGQVRLDCLCPSIELDSSTSLFLGFDRRHDSHPYVTTITTTPYEPESRFGRVLQLSCHGRLEWFWSRYQTYVIYNEVHKSIGTI